MIQLTPPVRSHLCLGVASASGLAIISALKTPPVPLPDSYEMLAAGRCTLGAGPCGELESLWWPPLFGLISAVLEVFLPTGSALALSSLVPMSVACVVLTVIAGRAGGTITAAVAACLLAVQPALHAQAMTADARGLLLLFSALAWSCATGKTSRSALLAGICAGLAVLSRTEALLVAAALPLVIGFQRRSIRSALMSALGITALAGPWWAMLSHKLDRPAILPRTVEAWALPLLDVLPRADVVQLIGASAGATPFRSAAYELGPASTTSALDIGGGIDWLLTQAPAVVGLTGLLGLGGLAISLWQGKRWELVAPLGLAAPTFITAMLPQGRDELAPHANMIGLVAASVIFTACLFSGHITTRAARLRSSTILAAVICVGLVCTSLWRGLHTERLLPALEASAPGRAVIRDLADFPSGTVQAAFESAPLVHLSERPWTPWPDQWLSPVSARAPIAAIITDVDPMWRRALRDDGWQVHRIYGDDRGWVALLRPRHASLGAQDTERIEPSSSQ